MKHSNRGREEALSNHPVVPAIRPASQVKWGSESRIMQKRSERGTAFPWHRGSEKYDFGEMRWTNSFLFSSRV